RRMLPSAPRCHGCARGAPRRPPGPSSRAARAHGRAPRGRATSSRSSGVVGEAARGTERLGVAEVQARELVHRRDQRTGRHEHQRECRVRDVRARRDEPPAEPLLVGHGRVIDDDRRQRQDGERRQRAVPAAGAPEVAGAPVAPRAPPDIPALARPARDPEPSGARAPPRTAPGTTGRAPSGARAAPAPRVDGAAPSTPPGRGVTPTLPAAPPGRGVTVTGARGPRHGSGTPRTTPPGAGVAGCPSRCGPPRRGTAGGGARSVADRAGPGATLPGGRRSTRSTGWCETRSISSRGGGPEACRRQSRTTRSGTR